MAIDRIGSGKGLPPPTLEAPELSSPELSSPELSSPELSSSEIGSTGLGASARGGGAGAARAEDAGGASAVEGVRDGTVELSDYLEQHVQEATAHLDVGLEPGQLELVREQLREQLAGDPWVRQLVLEACGQLPASDPQ